MATCIDCGATIRSSATRCQPCYKARRHEDRKVYTCMDCGGPRSKASYNGRCRNCCYEPRKRAMPDDFAEVAPTMSSDALARHYGCSTAKITEWFADLGLSRTHQTRFAAVGRAPAHFAIVAPTRLLCQLVDEFGHGECVIKRWCIEEGVQPRAYNPKTISRSTNMLPTVSVSRIMSTAERAAEFLTHYGPVYRCNSTGGADPEGRMWNRGGFVLSDADIIARAERLGWEAEAWRKLAA